MTSLEITHTIQTTVGVNESTPVNNTTSAVSSDRSSQAQRSIFTALNVIVWSTGLFGNLLVMVAVVRYRKLRTSPNILIACLASADFLYNCFSIFGHINLQNYNSFLCLCSAIFILPTFMCSVHIQTLISVNRYVLVTKTKETYEKLFSKKPLAAIIVLTWLCEFLVFCLLPGFLAGWKPLAAPVGVCLFFQDKLEMGDLILGVTWVSFGLSLYCYLMLLVFVKRKSMAMTSVKKRDAKTSFTLFIILVFFIVSFNILPIVLYFLSTIFFDEALLSWLGQAVIIIQSTNMCINPVIYSLRMKQFKIAFQNLICLWRKKIAPAESSTGGESTQT